MTHRANHNIITLTAEFIHQTDNAYLLDFATKEGKIWLPKSMCQLDRMDWRLTKGLGVEVQIDENYAIEKGCC